MSTSGLHNESVGYNGGTAEQDGPPPPPPQPLPTSQSNIQLGVTCKVVTGGRGHTATVYPDSSAIPGVPVDAPLTVKQHFQQQRKQQKNRARESKRDTRRQAPANTTVTSVPIQSQGSLKDEKVTGIGTDPKILHPTRALSEPAFLNQHQLHQARPSTSKSADQDILRNTNMKIDPRLLGCFSAEDCAIVHGTVTSKESLCSPTKVPIEIGAESALESSLRSTLDSSMQSYDPPFHLSGSKTEQKLDDMLVRNEGVRNDFIQYPSIKCENLLSHSLTVHPNDNSGLGGCGTMDFSNVYSSVDGLDMPTMQIRHRLIKAWEKLDTETDERFLSWLYCENEHAEDDNAEYTRVLEEIEKDECYTHKLEDSQGPDFGVSSCIPSTSRDDSFGKAELDFSHSLPPDLVAGDYTSGQPTLQQRDTLPENYPMSDFDSDLELDVMAIREDEETLYGRLLDVLVRDIKLLTYNNAALVDEVSRLNYAIFVASEERKMLARRSCHHDRNRIRRLQTANKRKSDAQRRQQEQLTLAETQENIAQIKAKMAKTIASPQKVQTKPSMCSASSRPTLDVAAIKRSVEAEQRALEEKNLSRKPKKVGSSKFHRKRHERSRSERKRTYPSATAAKRGRSELGQRGQATVSSEGNSPVTSESVHPARKSIRGPS
ncbi:hypothetical protein KIN20_004312 [Parelaphostrongylus tenuis]|uniref:Uncharacterized protein n=1 Tax=Parelaphostrongylus tenuis TaxID=148309 RepID=A0AAD5M0G5_PARTN|nr:hypothetical protein KIN20_004312 [Parelaphostrongylus tenuis]